MARSPLAAKVRGRQMEPGEIFEERYRIGGPLGTGGQSNVYRGDELATGRRVAIKLLLDEGDGVRFIREGRVVSRLKSPHAVQLIEFGRTTAGRFFHVFEFVAGDNLAQVVRRGAPLPWPRVARLIRQVLEALAEAHDLGVVHRDIKPSNIMLAPGDVARVLDFGVARLDQGEGEGLTATGEVLGTPRYISPEALSGAEVTPAADVYGVGLVAWELLVGSPANNALNGADVVLRHLDPEPFRLPIDLAIPENARRWVHLLCDKDTGRRPRDAKEALAELDVFEDAPKPLVAQLDPDYSGDGEETDTGVLTTAPHKSLAEREPTLDVRPDLDPTEPDPWRPNEVLPVDPPAPPQIASKGIQRNEPPRQRPPVREVERSGGKSWSLLLLLFALGVLLFLVTR